MIDKYHVFLFFNMVPCWGRKEEGLGSTASKCLLVTLARSVRVGCVYKYLCWNKHTEALRRLLVKGILVLCQPGSEEMKNTAEFMKSSLFSPLGGKQSM